MRLILVRHALSVENERDIVNGYGTPGSLSPLGMKQAMRTAEFLSKERVDAIFSSDLRRALQTAEIIASFHRGVPIIKSRDIRERDYGVFEGRPTRELFAARQSLGMERHEFRPEGGESFADIRERAARFYDMLLGKYMDRNVLVVSHGQMLSTLIGVIIGEGIEDSARRGLKNASVSVLETDGKAIKSSSINNTEHLKGLR
jgi:broad specificity phosphatase PhoE